MSNVSLVERNYPETFARFTSLGPALEQFGNGAKGINWEAKREIEMLGDLNGRVPAGPTAGRPKIDSDIDACEMILMLAPETNGEVAVKAWRSEEHTSEIQSLMRISYAVFCLKKKKHRSKK